MSLSVLNPDQIVGRWFAHQSGLIGFVKFRFDRDQYLVRLTQPKENEQLLSLVMLSECRFFDSEIEASTARSDEYDAAAQMGSEQP